MKLSFDLDHVELIYLLKALEELKKIKSRSYEAAATGISDRLCYEARKQMTPEQYQKLFDDVERVLT